MTAPPDRAPVTPLPLGPGARRVLLFGGTFDPPHTGHTRLPAAARDRLWPGRDDAWIVFVPAARSPHKTTAARASDEDRVAMLRRAAEGIARAVVWTDEIDRARWSASRGVEAPSYTVDTVDRAREVLPAAPRIELRLLIGADQAAAFHRWRSPRRIIALAPPVVMSRTLAGSPALAGDSRATAPEGPVGGGLWGEPDSAGPAVAPARAAAAVIRGAAGATLRDTLEQTGAWTPGELEDWELRALETPLIPVSSTAVRAALASPTRDRDSLRRMLGDSVLAYIDAKGLYRPA